MDDEDICPQCGSKNWRYIEYCYEDFEEFTMEYCNFEHCDYQECINVRNIAHLLHKGEGPFNGVRSS